MPCELTLDRESRIPLFRQLVDQLRVAIYAGHLAAGEQLPSVRQMAATVGADPLTVARAINELEAEGLVVCKRGKGNFVRSLSEERREHARWVCLLEAARKLASRATRLGFELEDTVSALRAVSRKRHKK